MYLNGLSFAVDDSLINRIVNSDLDIDEVSQLGLEGVSNVPLDALADTVVSGLALNPLVGTVAQTFTLSHGLPTAAGVIVGVIMMVPVSVAQALIIDPVAQAVDPSAALNLVQAINASVAQTGMEPIAQAVHGVQGGGVPIAQAVHGVQGGGVPIAQAVHGVQGGGGPVMQAVHAAQGGGEPVVQGTVEFANLSLEERAPLPVAEALDNSSTVSSVRDHSYSL